MSLALTLPGKDHAIAVCRLKSIFASPASAPVLVVRDGVDVLAHGFDLDYSRGSKTRSTSTLSFRLVSSRPLAKGRDEAYGGIPRCYPTHAATGSSPHAAKPLSFLTAQPCSRRL